MIYKENELNESPGSFEMAMKEKSRYISW